MLFWLILLDLFVASLPTTLFSVWNWENDIAKGEGIVGKEGMDKGSLGRKRVWELQETDSPVLFAGFLCTLCIFCQIKFLSFI